MKTWQMYCTGLLTAFAVTSTLWAQVPAGGAAAGAGGGAAAGAGGAAGAAGEATKGFPFIKKFQEQKEICKRKLCETPLGALINNMTKPFSAMTGGLIPPCCPTTPSAEELAAAADDPGPLGAAAAVAMDEAKAKKRKAAVRYMSTVDCHWWPEVEKALIIALRTDRNECVRLEAAIGLGKGCCCTRKVIEALAITVEASSKDGNPSENSDRVRACALASLNHCLCCYRSPAEPVDGDEKEKAQPLPGTAQERLQPQPLPATLQGPLAAFKGSLQLTPYYAQVEKKSMAAVVARARKVAEAAAGSGPLAPRPPETCFRDLLFPSMASSETTVAGSDFQDGAVIQTSGSTAVMEEMPTPMVPVTERLRLMPRRWNSGQADIQESAPVYSTPEPVQVGPMTSSSPYPTRNEGTTKGGVVPKIVERVRSQGQFQSRNEPVETPMTMPSQTIVAETSSKPTTPAIVQAGHRVVSTSNVEGADMIRPASPYAMKSETPVPITDLIGPNGSAVLRGEPVVERKTFTTPVPVSPQIIASSPAPAAQPAAVRVLPAPPPVVSAPVTPAPVGNTAAAALTPAPASVAIPGAVPAAAPAATGNPLGRLFRHSEPEAPKGDATRLLRALQNDGNIAARRRAVEELESQNLQSCREAVPVLLNGACADTDADVRVRCIRCLLKLNPSDTQLRTLVDRLANDGDGEVQFQLFLVRQRMTKG